MRRAFDQIFRARGDTRNIPPKPDSAEYLRKLCLREGRTELRACYPGDICNILVSIGKYEGRRRHHDQAGAGTEPWICTSPAANGPVLLDPRIVAACEGSSSRWGRRSGFVVCHARALEEADDINRSSAPRSQSSRAEPRPQGAVWLRLRCSVGQAIVFQWPARHHAHGRRRNPIACPTGACATLLRLRGNQPVRHEREVLAVGGP